MHKITQTNATQKKHRDHHKARVMSCFKFKKGNVYDEEKKRENDREKASEREREKDYGPQFTLFCVLDINTGTPMVCKNSVQLRSSIMRHIVIQ